MAQWPNCEYYAFFEKSLNSKIDIQSKICSSIFAQMHFLRPIIFHGLTKAKIIPSETLVEIEPHVNNRTDMKVGNRIQFRA